MVPEGSVGVFGSVMVVDLEGVVVSGGVTATGGPMREAGAVGSAAAGRPGVCAIQAPAAPSAAITTSGKKVF